jgi:hypothetical protein
MGTPRDNASNPPKQAHDKGKNLGQGLAGITDKQRRDLAGRGDDAPTKDQATADQRGKSDRKQDR